MFNKYLPLCLSGAHFTNITHLKSILTILYISCHNTQGKVKAKKPSQSRHKLISFDCFLDILPNYTKFTKASSMTCRGPRSRQHAIRQLPRAPPRRGARARAPEALAAALLVLGAAELPAAANHHAASDSECEGVSVQSEMWKHHGKSMTNRNSDRKPMEIIVGHCHLLLSSYHVVRFSTSTVHPHASH